MLENSDLQLLNVGYDSNGAGWQWKDVCSPFVRIYLVEQGEATLLLEDQKLDLKSGYLYLIPPFRKHTCMGIKGFAHYYLHFYESPGTTSSLFDEFDFGQEVYAREGDKDIFRMLVTNFPDSRLNELDPKIYDNDVILRYSCCNFSQHPPCEKILAQGAILVLLSRFINRDESKKLFRSPKIRKVCGYINSHLSVTLSLDNLARIACMSESNFIRAFKKEIGITPAQYIIQRRIEAAQLLLLLNNDPIKNISEKLGFTDSSHFIRTFKKYTGDSPQEFRRRPLI